MNAVWTNCERRERILEGQKKLCKVEYRWFFNPGTVRCQGFFCREGAKYGLLDTPLCYNGIIARGHPSFGPRERL